MVVDDPCLHSQIQNKEGGVISDNRIVSFGNDPIDLKELPEIKIYSNDIHDVLVFLKQNITYKFELFEDTLSK